MQSYVFEGTVVSYGMAGFHIGDDHQDEILAAILAFRNRRVRLTIEEIDETED